MSAAFDSNRCALINKMVFRGFPVSSHKLGIPAAPEAPARFLKFHRDFLMGA